MKYLTLLQPDKTTRQMLVNIDHVTVLTDFDMIGYKSAVLQNGLQLIVKMDDLFHAAFPEYQTKLVLGT